jgi:hypothetical protein
MRERAEADAGSPGDAAGALIERGNTLVRNGQAVAALEQYARVPVFIVGMPALASACSNRCWWCTPR